MRRSFFLFFLFSAIFYTAGSCVSAEAAEIPSDNLKVIAQQVPLGQSLSIPGTGIQRYLVTKSDIVEVAGQTGTALVLKGGHLGTTMVLVWDASGLRSIRVEVVQPKEEIERRDRLIRDSSPTEKEKKRRSFKVVMEESGSILRTGKALADLDEVDKINDQKLRVEGVTPVGNMKSDIFMEAKKDRVLERVVWTPRDASILLTKSPLPVLKKFNVRAGANYYGTHDFAMPYTRFNGLTLTPPRAQDQKPQKGSFEPTFLIGKKRDGGYYDNPSSIINRNLKDRLAAEHLDYHFSEDGKVYAGSAQRWSGPSNGQAHYDNYAGYAVTFLPWSSEAQIGSDDRQRTSMTFLNRFEKDWFSIQNKWRNISKDYRTVSGPVTAAGELGTDTSIHLVPFKPLFAYEKLSFDVDVDIYKTRNFPNPQEMKSVNQNWYVGALWMLPYELNFRSSYSYRDYEAQSFPYLQTTTDFRLSRGFEIENFLIKRIELSSLVKMDNYDKAIGTSGFNSTRFEYGGGIDMTLSAGFWASASYFKNRLEEMDPSMLPAVTFPSQENYAIGYSHALWTWPASVNISLRYSGDAETFGKIHQPYSNEKRLSSSFGFDWRLQNGTSAYTQISTSKIESIIEGPKKAEMSIDFGVKVPWDTGWAFTVTGLAEGTFFKDLNANGVLDPDEPRMENMQILSDDGAKAVTDKNGYYQLKLPAGDVTIRAASQIPPGYFYTTANQKKLTVLEGKTSRLDLGIAAQSHLQGRVYVDLNENGIYDEPDMAISGVRVGITGGPDAWASELGLYSILKVPVGAQKARIDLDTIPYGYKTMTPVEKAFDAQPGADVEYDVVFRAQRSVAGMVFVDSDGDGVMGPEEKPLPGVKVVFQGAVKTTNDKGAFLFRGVKSGLKQTLSLDPASLPADKSPGKAEITIDIPLEPFVKNDANLTTRPLESN